jgi:flagellar biosynthesis protein FliP/flagellar motor switch protein FliG
VLALAAAPALAQEVSIDFGEGGSLDLRTVQILILLTVLSLAPGLAIMVTCFPFMVTVLSILRQAVGVQQAPPNMLIVSLALFLTWFVMEPVFREAWETGVRPMIDGALTPEAAFVPIMAPFRAFMEGRVDPATLEALAEAAPGAGVAAEGPQPLSVLVPAFILGEIKRGFEVGFLIFLPFLGDRPRHRRHPDVHGHDDGAARHRLASVQARLFRDRGRLDAARGRPRAELRAMTDAALVPAQPGEPARLGAPGAAPVAPIEKAAILLAAIGPELGGGLPARARGIRPDALRPRAQRARAGGSRRARRRDRGVPRGLANGPDLAGDTEAARKLLSAVLDEDEIARLFEGKRGAQRSVWDRLNDTPLAPLANFLQAEHPQTAALIVSELRPEVAAGALERLDRAFAQSVVMRLSRVPTLDAPISAAIQGAIERDFLSVLQRNLSKRRPAELIAGLMNNVSSEARDGFLAHLEGQDPALAADVQRTMFTFEDIPLRVSPRDVAAVLRDISEEVLLPALKLAVALGSPTPRFVFDNLPRRLAERYAEDVENMLDVPRKEGEAARSRSRKRSGPRPRGRDPPHRKGSRLRRTAAPRLPGAPPGG